MKPTTVTGTLTVVGFAALIFAVVRPPSERPVQGNDLFTRIANALEAYALDNGGAYPVDKFGTQQYVLNPILTTPIPYLAAADILDAYARPHVTTNLRYVNFDVTFGESAFISQRNAYPHYLDRHGHWLIWSGTIATGNPETGLYFDPVPYDATNGTQLTGSQVRPSMGAFRSQKMRSETGFVQN